MTEIFWFSDEEEMTAVQRSNGQYMHRSGILLNKGETILNDVDENDANAINKHHGKCVDVNII